MSKPLIVITGASSGIGEATARAFSEQGYPLLLLARRLDRMLALELPDCLCVAVDVTDRESVQAAIKQGEEKFGPVDCILNNAGVMLLEQVVDQDPSEWDRMLQVNVSGVLNGIHAVLAGMKQRQHGSIINISSTAGHKLYDNHTVYCATKFAVQTLTEGLRQEMSSSNVRVMTVSPGAVETELLSHTTSDAIRQGYEDWKVDMGGVLKAEDIANAVLFAYLQPQHVCVRDLVITATRQEP